MSTLLQPNIRNRVSKTRLLNVLIAIEAILLIWWRFPAFFAQFHLDNTLWASEKLAWYLTRSSGTVAYIILSAATVWGLLLSSKLIKEVVPAPVALAMHNALSWIAIGLVAFHGFVLLFDTYYTYTIGDLLIPFAGPYKALWVGIGTLAFYLGLMVSATFYMRRWIGAKRWRQLHYLTFVSYVMATLHGWLVGTDSAAFAWLYAASASVVLFLTLYRIIATHRSAGNDPVRKLQHLPN